MKTISKKLIYLLFTLVLFSCEINNYPPNSARITKTETLDNFEGVNIEDNMDVNIIKSKEFKITSKGIEYDIDNLYIRVRNGVLNVSCDDKNWFRNKKKIELIIEMPAINYLKFSGATDGSIENFGRLSKLEVNLTGASSLKIETETEKLYGKITGASELKVENNSKEIDLQLTGASELSAYEANASKVYLDLSGASEAYISVSDLLKVTASGASDVVYKGNPEIQKNISGSSSIKKY